MSKNKTQSKWGQRPSFLVVFSLGRPPASCQGPVAAQSLELTSWLGTSVTTRSQASLEAHLKLKAQLKLEPSELSHWVPPGSKTE